jgi:hypothetical protein
LVKLVLSGAIVGSTIVVSAWLSSYVIATLKLDYVLPLYMSAIGAFCFDLLIRGGVSLHEATIFVAGGSIAGLVLGLFSIRRFRFEETPVSGF